MNLYDILGLKSNASEQEIKKAYYRLSKKYHPDKCNDVDAREKFYQINSAYQMLIDNKTRETYSKMNKNEQYNFTNMISKIFSNDIKLDDFKILGIKISMKDYEYLQTNFTDILNFFNFKELINLFLNGSVPIKNKQNINCSDTDKECWDEDQAEYYYNLPINYYKINKLDIRITINVTLDDIINQTRKQIKIKKKLEDEECNTTFIFTPNKPYVVYYCGGDMDDGEYGNLIIELKLPQNFYWQENLIIYDYMISIYNMMYGIDIKIDVGEKIEYNNWVPYRDGFYIDVDKVKIHNHNFAIKFSLNYEHSENKEEILKSLFN